MSKFRFALVIRAVAVFCTVAAVSSYAQTFKTIVTFDGTDGANVPAALIQGTDGSLYGVTENQGPGAGTAFKIMPNGKLITIHNFCSQTHCTDGSFPNGSLILAVDGSLYGTTLYGGANNSGSVFQITPAGKFNTLYSFCSAMNCSDGGAPLAGLVMGTNGNFYGTTSNGGAAASGTVFEITPAGKLTTLYSFCPSGDSCPDGAYPWAPLTLASNGEFYGTTNAGGSQGGGVVFAMTPAGKVTTLYSFCSLTNCTDGSFPYAGMVQGSNGTLYGTTYYGGANCLNGGGCGTIYQMSLSGKLTTLYSFCSVGGFQCSDGMFPVSGVVQATDGNLYGTTSQGGNNNSGCLSKTVTCGTVFRITPQGTLTTLYDFCSQSGCRDGGSPRANLVQSTNGIFYGSTFLDGDAACVGGEGCGTVFALSMGLGGFVEANPNFGRAGQIVDILGTSLKGTTKVTFNGTSASFRVISNTYIKARIPSGATTGTIEVTTPSETLLSNASFHVLP